MTASLTASQLQGMATRYNTVYSTLLTREVGQGHIPFDVQTAITSMLSDLSTLMTAINTDDTLGVTIAGYGVLPASAGLASIQEASATSVSIAGSGYFTSPTAVSAYAGSNLPSWLTLNTSTGALTGTAPTVTTSVTYEFTVTATNAFGTATTTFKLTVG